MPITDWSVTCSNYKCIATDTQGFAHIKPINVIIGRNNSGKTTLLDLIEYCCDPVALPGLGHRGSTPAVTLSATLNDELLKSVLKNDSAAITYGSYSGSFTPLAWAQKHLIGKAVTYELCDGNNMKFLSVDGATFAGLREQAELEVVCRFLAKLKRPFTGLSCLKIVADRDIVAEEPTNREMHIAANGDGLTYVIERYLNNELLNSALIEQTLLDDLNLILKPDADYKRILVQRKKDSEQWEIYLEDSQKVRVRMSHTGSGFKTVLLVLANMHLVPLLVAENHQIPLSDIVYCLEELENNLHPAIQRRLFRYLRDKVVETGCHLFITTHSEVVINLFAGDPLAQVLHVTQNGGSSQVSAIETFGDSCGVLDDLDVRASDLLQTNAVVWLEGPSDRIYFNKWIEIWTKGRLIEGEHYQCLMIGGSLNAHLSFLPPEQEEEDLIKALKANRHAILLLDSDKREQSQELKKHTERLLHEVSKSNGYAWVTEGKEVENYIPRSVLKSLAGDKGRPGPRTNVLGYLERYRKKKTTKVKLAHKVVEQLSYENILETLDLASRVTEVCEHICDWNRLDRATIISNYISTD